MTLLCEEQEEGCVGGVGRTEGGCVCVGGGGGGGG